jgi:hypothetical protein
MLRRVGIVSLIFLLLFIIALFCSVVFLERHVVYTREGAMLDMSVSANEIIGEVATPPVGNTGITIFYNEGADAINMSDDLQQLDGYFIDIDDLKTNIAGCWDLLEPLKANTPIMIDLKGGYGSAYYSSTLPGIITSSEVSVASVDELIGYMNEKNFYTIARISAFRDYNYGLNNVPCGLPDARGDGYYLRADDGGCYWLDPSEPQVITWLCSIIKELKELGFNEVVLDNFRFPPNPDLYIFSGDRDQALAEAAEVIISNCASDGFTISFVAAGANFALPEGRTRLYLSGVEAKEVGAKAAQANLEEPQIRLVFLADTNDTRFDEYGVLRPIEVSGVIEAQKADQAAQEEE